MQMATYDPDVVRWNLHLLDVCSLTNSGYCNAVTHYDQDLGRVESVREGYCENSNVENDEAVARALQEEFRRIDSLEASGLRNVGERHIQASVLAQDWLGPSKRYCTSGGDYDKIAVSSPGRNMQAADPCRNTMEEADNRKIENHLPVEIGSYPLCFSQGETSSYVEDFSNTMDITDEFALDGEVGKRLNQMVPVPHVPKTNVKIPSADEEISDHQRLLERLQLYDLVELKVHGDGNCQFRALSDQLYRSPEQHAFVREQIIQQLMGHPTLYEGYVPMAYNDYLKKMSKSGEWGDHVTLQAAADWYGVKIFVLTSFKDTCYIEILPHLQKSNRIFFLSFWAEVHYNSIYPEGDLPPLSPKRKKKWWDIGSLIGS